MTTHTIQVASNVCGDLPKWIPVNIDCSLCALGFPQQGGMIGINFYGPRCIPTADPSPSYWLGYETKYATWRCPDPGDAEPAPNTWVATGFFAGATKTGCANQYRFDATLTAVDETHITVSVSVKVLKPTVGGNHWVAYLSWSETLTEIANTDTTRYRGRAFASPTFQSVTPDIAGGKGDPVSFAKMTVGLISMKVGCGGIANAVPVCGFWNGTEWLTCLRAEVQSLADTSIRQFVQLGFNTSGCGGLGSYCRCDTIKLTSLSPVAGTTTYNADPQFVTDYGVLGLPGGLEAVGADQQIQIAPATASGILVVAKQVNGGDIYICTNDSGAGWVCSVAVQVQAQGPRILTATRATFQVFLYALPFPNSDILAEICGSGGDYPTPSETDPWWCTPLGCVQSPVQPVDAYGGPWASSGACATGCALIPDPNPPWWCVGTTCVQSSTPPEGYSSGPYSTEAACLAICDPPPEGDYWCLYGNCVQSVTSPHADATGPYATPELCAAACPGPAVMVWVCTDAGCGTTPKSAAVINGWTYWTLEADCITNCPSEWWCVPDGCLEWFGGGTPPDAISGPYATDTLCYESCEEAGGPGWYCVDGVCGSYPDRPTGAVGPKHATYAACVDACFVLGINDNPAPFIEAARQPVIVQPKRPTHQQTFSHATRVLNDYQKKVVERNSTPCKFRLEMIEEAQCRCSSKRLYGCQLHGKCRLTLDPGDIDVEACADCDDYQKPQVI